MNLIVIRDWILTAIAMIATGVCFACAVIGVEPWNL